MSTDTSAAAEYVNLRIQAAEMARDALSAALRQAGIQFPATDLGLKPQKGGNVNGGYALIELGQISEPVALQLADVIMRGVRS